MWPLALPSTMDSGRTRRRPVSLLTSTRATAPSGPSGPSITAHLRHSASRLLSSPGGTGWLQWTEDTMCIGRAPVGSWCLTAEPMWHSGRIGVASGPGLYTRSKSPQEA